jgi:hypothetical protein
MTQDTVQLIEESIQRNRQLIEMDKALERLESNKDFKLLIIDGYLRDEAVRLVHLKCDPGVQAPEKQASILAQINAISALVQHFRAVGQMAAMAAKAIESDEAERDELLSGGLSND